VVAEIVRMKERETGKITGKEERGRDREMGKEISIVQ